MRNTTSPSSTPSFESIDVAVLMAVQGGCGKKSKCCNCGPQAIAIAAAPAPAPAPAPMPMPMPSRPSVETSVDISYQ